MRIRLARVLVGVLLGSGLLACGDDPVDRSDPDDNESSNESENDEGGNDEGGNDEGEGGGSGDLVAGTCAIFQDFIADGAGLEERIAEAAAADVTSVEEGEQAIASLIEVIEDLRTMLVDTAEAASGLDGSGVENGEEFVETLQSTMGEAAAQTEVVLEDLESIDLAADPEGTVAIGEALVEVGDTFDEIFVPLSDERFQEISDELDAECEV